MSKLLFPFIYPITLPTLYFGGIDNNMVDMIRAYFRLYYLYPFPLA